MRLKSNNTKQVSANGRKSDDYITYRVVLAFIEAAVFLLLMSKLQAAIVTPTTYKNALAACLIIAAVSCVCAIAGAVSYIISVRKGTYRSERIFNGMFLAAAAAVITISSLILYFDPADGMRVIYVFIPASAILFLVYSVYPKTLFVTSATHIYVAFTFYALRRMTVFNVRLTLLLAALVVCAVALALYFATVKKKGCIQVAGVRFVLFDRTTNRNYLLLLYGVTAAALVAVFFLPAVAAFYAMIATILYMVCAVVHGTVKMM